MKRTLKKAMSIFICISIIILIVSFSACSNTEHFVKIVDSKGNQIATVTNAEPFEAELTNESYLAYVQIAFNDAVELIKSKNDCGDKSAQRILFKECTIVTSLDKSAFDACDKAYKSLNLGTDEFAFALTDLNGNLICAYSASNKENFAAAKTQPYSSFKPLSVYAPAIENDVINYSSMFLDAPIKQVYEDGVGMTDWPQNPQNNYQNTKVSVAEGVKHSYNTTAINCLLKFGVRNSVDFLTKNFSIDLSNEIDDMNSNGEDEILSEIGLGYLYSGVSPVDMAGYYQIFAKGGKYIKPSAVATIKNKGNEVLFERNKNEIEVIKSDTACIMNYLLQNTLSPGGTAEKAYCDGVQIGGKTGTGDNSSDNWFVGFSPEYSFAVWHGKSFDSKNQCAMIFNSIAENLIFDKSKSFELEDGVEKCVYCTQSGKLLGNNCTQLDVGYYKENNIPDVCEENHNLQ